MKSPQPEVDVLLATFNGEKYLEEFLDSLALQENVKINLYISDDNSSDQTLDILSKYNKQFKKLIVLRGPENGPAENFFSLLKHGDSEYVAFADQDDIWEKDHLEKSVSRLNGWSDSPALTFCDVLEFYSDGTKNRVWPNLNREPSAMQLGVQNFARGCTIVFNKCAKNLILEKPVSGVIMHDWWIYLIISSCGEVIYANSVEINYRVHDNNFIGVSRKTRGLRERLKQPWPTVAQIEKLLENYQERMKEAERIELLEFYNYFQKHIIFRLLHIGSLRGRLRSNLLDELKIRIAIIVLPYEKRKVD